MTSTAAPRPAMSSSAWWIKVAAPASTAPGRLHHHQLPRRAQQLAADDELLQVAAGQRGRQRPGAAAADVEAPDRLLGHHQRPAPVDEAMPRAAVVERGQAGVLPQPQLGHRAVAVALLGDEAHAQPAARRRRQPARRRAPFKRMLSAATGSSPDSAEPSSAWPLPATPAMPTILPASTRRLMSLSSCAKGPCGGRLRPRSSREWSASSWSPRRRGGLRLAPDHHFGEARRGLGGRIRSARPPRRRA